MRHLIIASLLALSLFSCSDNPGTRCDGYEAEPSIDISCSLTDTFGVLYLNQFGSGDTLFSEGRPSITLPIDPGSDTMFYELVIADTSSGEFQLVYTLEHRYCESTDQLNLHFLDAKFLLSDLLPVFKAISEGTGVEIDSKSEYSGFLNNTLSDHRFEFEI